MLSLSWQPSLTGGLTVSKYNVDKYVKHFTCWNQLLALMFGQLSNRESLRDLIIVYSLLKRISLMITQNMM